MAGSSLSYIINLNKTLISTRAVLNKPGLSKAGWFCLRTLSFSKCRQNDKDEGTTHQQYTEEDHEFHVQDEELEYEHSVRQKILLASLPHVHEHGWTKKTLEAGAHAEGLPGIAQGMFPRGGAELIDFFYRKSNSELTEILRQKVEAAEAEGLERPKTKPFIRDAIETRLQMILPYIDTWPQAIAIQALPPNVCESGSNLLNLMDDIWYYAGDRSVDFNWYTKRMALAGVYKSTEIYLVQDKSQNQQDTWAFLDRRLMTFQKFAAKKKNLEQSSDVFKEVLKGFSIMGRNIMGINSRSR